MGPRGQVVVLLAVAVAGAARADDLPIGADLRSNQIMAERTLALGEYARGEPYAAEWLRMAEHALPADDPQLADAALALGIMRGKGGAFASAEALLRRAVAIREHAHGGEAPDVAAALLALGVELHDAAAISQAGPVLARALAIEEKQPGAERSLSLSRALDADAMLLAESDDPRSEPMLQRALAIAEAAAGRDAPDVVEPLRDLADLRFRRGDAAGAEPLYRRGMAILDSPGETGLGDPRRAAMLRALARLRFASGARDEAVELAALAYTVDSHILGADHPFVARDLLELADFARAAGDAPRAERYVWQGLAIRERALGPDHPDVGEAAQALAASYAARGDLANAAKLIARALAIYRKSLGARHPAVATALVAQARVALAQGDIPRALDAMTEAGDIREASLEILLYAGSERQKRLYLSTLADETDTAVGLFAQLAPADARAAKLAMFTVLRRKGRVLDAMVDTTAALRRRVAPADATALDQLAAARSELATVVLRGPDRGEDAAAHARAIAALDATARELEAAVGAKGLERGVRSPAITFDGVQAAIPDDHVLVEIVSYQPLALRGDAPARRYGAFVLARRGEPRWIDLGAQADVDALVGQARTAFADPQRDPSAIARALDAKLMTPLRPLAGDARHLLLSPDGALDLLPFGALQDERGRFEIERYTITYLTTGRDLARIAAPAEPGRAGAALIVADPDFGPTGAFARLPATADEGRDVARILGTPTLLVGASATESSIEAARAPIVLHLATHGFFLGDEPGDRADVANTRGIVRVPRSSIERRVPDNPLLRSGVALAGANRHGGGHDDGVMTALEAAGLDLFGTQLVVLSACDTGVGEIDNGEGVYGLRRALVMAGSATQVISLWSVDDRATRELMVAFYTHLVYGAGRADALRDAQLAMIASRDHHHPVYWAAFIPSGDWRPLAGDDASRLLHVRGARGCGCTSGEAPPPGAIALVAVLALGLLRRRRAAAVIVLALPLAARAAPATQTMPASRLEVALPDAASWTVGSSGPTRRDWDIVQRASDPSLSVSFLPLYGPTTCRLALNMRYLDAMSVAHAVEHPDFLPAEAYPEALVADLNGATAALTCIDVPDGIVTTIVRYASAADARLAGPVIAAYASAAAWQGGVRPAAARVETLSTTGLAVEVPPAWKVSTASGFDVLTRRVPGKPTLAIGLRADPPVHAGAGDTCAFWADRFRIAFDPANQLAARPASVAAPWHDHVVVDYEPGHDEVTLCLDTPAGRWFATVAYDGRWTDADFADIGPILARVAAGAP